MKSLTCHSLYSCLVVLICFFLGILFGCEEKVTPPVKPPVVKKRIQQEKTEAVSETATSEEETRKAAEPSPGLTVDAESTPGSAPEPGAATAAANKDLQDKDSQEKIVPEKAEEDQAKASSTPGAIDEKRTSAEDKVTEKTGSLKTSIPDESWQYNPKGKIDPFAALFKEDGDTRQKKKGKLTRPLTPLEKIDLSQLKLVAIIRTESTSRAMVEDAAGKGYVLSVGTPIGTHSGKVVEIFKDRISIEEEMEDFLGRPKKAERELRLQKPSGEE